MYLVGCWFAKTIWSFIILRGLNAPLSSKSVKELLLDFSIFGQLKSSYSTSARIDLRFQNMKAGILDFLSELYSGQFAYKFDFCFYYFSSLLL